MSEFQASLHYNSFDKINAVESAVIYRQFIQGKVIPKQLFNEFQFKLSDNPLFTLLFSQQDHFEKLYQHLGFELCFHQEGDFFYVKELREEASEEADENALKVQTALLLLGRYYTGSGRDINLLADPQFGINEKDLANLKDNDEFNAILKAVRLHNWSKATTFLCDRHFAFKSGENSFFIGKAGQAFLNKLITEYQQRI